MALSVTPFWSIKPKLPFRFKAHFYTGIEKLNNILSISLTNITLPKMEGKVSEGSMYLGNTIFTMPTWSIGSRKIEITFEETDFMTVSQFIDLINNKSWCKAPYRITIAIEEFDDKMRYSKSTGYVCHLGSYTEPQFKRDGSAGQVTMSATFIIDAIIDEWDESKAVVGTTNVTDNPAFNKVAIFGEQENVQKMMKTNLDKSRAGYKAKNGSIVTDKAGGQRDDNYKGVDRGLLNAGGKKITEFSGDEDKVRENMRRMGIDDKEIDRQLNALKKDSYKDDIQLQNMEALSYNLANAAETLKNSGITMKSSCWVTGDHVAGDNYATHGIGAKADINFFRADGTKIEYNNASVEEINMIQQVLNANGLYMQFEGNPHYGDETGWGDIVLNEFMNSKGNVINDKAGRDERKNNWGEYFKYKDDKDHSKK